GRPVALKVLRAGLDSEHRLRFAIEAEVLGKLRHRGIAHLYQSGSIAIDGVEHAFLAMEYVEGPDLHEWSERERPDLETCVRLIADVATAMEYAHRRGVVHRDLKPRNVLVETTDGRP